MLHPIQKSFNSQNEGEPSASSSAAGPVAAPPATAQKAVVAVDGREQLINGGEIGPITRVSMPLDMITSLRGVLLDFDPDRLRMGRDGTNTMVEPDVLYQHIQPMLARHPVLARAEVRSSGRGLHVIIWFKEPVEFTTDADRVRWAAIVKVIQRLLPTDPDCPGITALTRPLGSLNSKNGGIVSVLHQGEPVPAEEVLGLFELARKSPFRTVAHLLFGTDHIAPCPVCKNPKRKLDALDFVGKC